MRQVLRLQRRRSSERAASASRSSDQRTTLIVNGRFREIEAGPTTRLLAVLRDQLGLRATKAACNQGECGSCTVIVGEQTVNACTTLAQRVRDPITTIEGVVDETNDLRAAFADAGAFQCGYCTPGQVVRAAWLLRHAGDWREDELRHLLAGNICRCTGYGGIVKAIVRERPQPASS